MTRVLLLLILLTASLAWDASGQVRFMQSQQVGMPSQNLVDSSVAGRLVMIDVVALYGRNLKQPAQTLAWQVDLDPKSGRFIADGLWVRIQEERRDAGGDVMVANQRHNSRCGIRYRGGVLRWSQTLRGHGNSMSTVEEVAPGLAVHEFGRWHFNGRTRSNRVARGFTRRQFALYVTEDSEWPLPDGPLSLSDVLGYLVEVTPKAGGADCAHMLLDLGRFSSLAEHVQGRALVKLMERANRKVRRGGFISYRSGSDPAEHTYLCEQAMLRAGLGDLVAGSASKSRTRWSDSYAVFRHLAETGAGSDEAQLVAFHRCQANPRGVDYHQEWIEMIRLGKIPVPEESRDEVIAELERQILSRSPENLAVVALVLLVCFAAAIIGVKVFTRRMMFAT